MNLVEGNMSDGVFLAKECRMPEKNHSTMKDAIGLTLHARADALSASDQRDTAIKSGIRMEISKSAGFESLGSETIVHLDHGKRH